MRKKSSHEETKLAQAPSEATIPAKSSENWMHALLGVFGVFVQHFDGVCRRFRNGWARD